MKRFLTILFLAFISFASQAQILGSFVTTHARISKMIWSESKQEWDFVDDIERVRYNCLWKLDVNTEGTGSIINENLGKNTYIFYKVYDVEPSPVERGTGLVFKCFETKGQEKITILITKYENGKRTVSVFNTDKGLVIFFDDFEITN